MWDHCLSRLESELPEQQFNTWIRPLHAIEDSESLRLLAPNRFVQDWVEENFLARIRELVLLQNTDLSVSLEIGSLKTVPSAPPDIQPANSSPRQPVAIEPIYHIVNEFPGTACQSMLTVIVPEKHTIYVEVQVHGLCGFTNTNFTVCGFNKRINSFD